MVRVCRTCLGQIANSNFVYLNKSSQSTKLKKELSVCLPELDIELTPNPVLCQTCINALHEAYTFKNRCLQSEKCILNYMKNIVKNVSLQEFCLSGARNSSLQSVDKQPSSSTSEESALFVHGMAPVPKMAPNQDVVEDLNSLLDDALGDILKQSASCDKESSEVKENNPILIEDEILEIEDEILEIKDLSSYEGNLVDTTVAQKRKVRNNANRTSATKQHSNQLGQNSFVDLPKKCSKASSSAKGKTKELQSNATTTNGRIYKYQNTLDICKKKQGMHKRFTCCDCDYSTMYKQHLLRHFIRHRREKSFSCNLCSFNTFQQAALAKHKMIHSLENNTTKSAKAKNSKIKIFSCNKCDYRAVQKHDFMRHLKIHKKLLHCTVCEFKSVWKHSLVQHMRIHTGERPFACNICEFKSTSSSALHRHSKKHTGERLSDVQ